MSASSLFRVADDACPFVPISPEKNEFKRAAVLSAHSSMNASRVYGRRRRKRARTPFTTEGLAVFLGRKKLERFRRVIGGVKRRDGLAPSFFLFPVDPLDVHILYVGAVGSIIPQRSAVASVEKIGLEYPSFHDTSFFFFFSFLG
jgi:hypothetical protein